MARALRIELEGAVYHVTARGNARSDIYLSDEDREMFLAALEYVVAYLFQGRFNLLLWTKIIST